MSNLETKLGTKKNKTNIIFKENSDEILRIFFFNTVQVDKGGDVT